MMSPEERIAALEAENAQLRQERDELRAALATAQAIIAQLEQRIKQLEDRLGLDSHNSGKPPSSDGFQRKTRSLRRPSGKRPGGQPGHSGASLQLTPNPDHVMHHRPSVCPACQA